MMKKMMLLAMAVAAVAAFAVPAAASASGTFVHNGGGALGEEEFTGKIGFKTPAGSYECDAHPVINLGTGAIVTLGLTTNACNGTGVLEGATLLAHQLTSGTVTATSEVVDIQNFELDNTFDTIGPVTLTFPTVTATPDNPLAISTLTISGEGIADTLLGELPAEAYGELEAANPETYGIE